MDEDPTLDAPAAAESVEVQAPAIEDVSPPTRCDCPALDVPHVHWPDGPRPIEADENH